MAGGNVDQWNIGSQFTTRNINFREIYFVKMTIQTNKVKLLYNTKPSKHYVCFICVKTNSVTN